MICVGSLKVVENDHFGYFSYEPSPQMVQIGRNTDENIQSTTLDQPKNHPKRCGFWMILGFYWTILLKAEYCPVEVDNT